MQLKVTSECIGCGQCVIQCPTRCLIIRNGRRVFIQPDNCSLCAHCFAICPVGAIEIFGIKAAQEEFQQEGANNIHTLVRYRRSIRKYKYDAIPEHCLSELCSVLRFCSSFCGVNITKIKVLSRSIMDDLGQEIANLLQPKFPRLPQQQNQLDIVFRGAPHCIVIYTTVTPEILPYKDIINDDMIAATTQLELYIQSKGYGSFWAGMLMSQVNTTPSLKKRLRLGEQDHVFSAIGVGIPAIRYVRSVGRLSYHVDFIE